MVFKILKYVFRNSHQCTCKSIVYLPCFLRPRPVQRNMRPGVGVGGKIEVVGKVWMYDDAKVIVHFTLGFSPVYFRLLCCLLLFFFKKYNHLIKPACKRINTQMKSHEILL